LKTEGNTLSLDKTEVTIHSSYRQRHQEFSVQFTDIIGKLADDRKPKVFFIDRFDVAFLFV
jgi:hypothetical protein